ncbi:MAG: hypothetical protein AAF744_02145 [Pseudomonadota bacterium]
MLIGTLRTVAGSTYATVSDPCYANVHVMPFDLTKAFNHDTSKGGFHVNFWSTTKSVTKPFVASSTGKAITICYRT